MLETKNNLFERVNDYLDELNMKKKFYLEFCFWLLFL